MSAYDLVPAFSQPVEGAQQTFRVLLKALSEPGQIVEVNHNQSLGALSAAGYAVALTLLDNDTTVWLSPALSTSLIRQNLAFHSGCVFVEKPEEAMFAFCTQSELAVLPKLNPGTDRDPEFSCTVIAQVDAMAGARSVWTGPGIEHQRELHLPLSADFWQQRIEKNQFPRGIDVLFVAQNQVLGLSRTTQVQFEIEG